MNRLEKVSCVNDVNSSPRLKSFKGVKITFGRALFEPVNQMCEIFSNCDSASSFTVAPNSVGTKHNKKRPVSVSHLVYVTGQVKKTAYARYVTKAVLFNYVVVLVDNI